MKIKSLIAIIILSAISAACAGIADEPPVPDNTEGFGLRVSVPLAQTGSRAPADDPLNEYRVENLHLYFFRLAGHDDATSEYLFDFRADETFSYAATFAAPSPPTLSTPTVSSAPMPINALFMPWPTSTRTCLRQRPSTVLKPLQ